jgi:NAD(P)-dependent dehydrogenase (short-subunit alcohol dehydrogenase family)
MAAKINAMSGAAEVIALQADLSTLEGIEALTAEMSAREEHIDILVNNAGAVWLAPLEDFTEMAWDKVMDINVKSIFFLIQKMLPLLKASEKGAKIINIASVDGKWVPEYETYSYSASKAAVIHLTKVLGKKLISDHINVNAIAPGPFPSDMTKGLMEHHKQALIKSIPKGRMGEPEDMAGTAIYLSSRASDYMVGVTLVLDGAWKNQY